MATDQYIFGEITNMYKWKDTAHFLAYVLRIHNRFDEILLMYFMHFCALWFPRFLVHNLKNTNNNEKKKKYNNTMTKSVAHYLRKFYLFFQIKKLSLLFALFLREKLVFLCQIHHLKKCHEKYDDLKRKIDNNCNSRFPN